MSIAENIEQVKTRIASAATSAGRPAAAVQLLAVSKTFGPDAVLEAVAAGQTAFGENYVQEAVDKMAVVAQAMPLQSLTWHFIGPIQSNKTKLIAMHFDWVHSIEREKIADRLSAQRPDNLPPLNVCIEVNVSGESSKSGVAPDEVLALARAISGMPRLVLRGLMAIPAPTSDQQKQHAAFAQMRLLFIQLQKEGFNIDTLSMGMSADLEVAVEEGATIVRVGSAILGHRNYQ